MFKIYNGSYKYKNVDTVVNFMFLNKIDWRATVYTVCAYMRRNI
jgi:hypothetical protein